MSLLISCAGGSGNSSNVNDWLNSLEPGMTQEQLEASKPDHVQIPWNTPLVVNDSTNEYDVTFQADRMDFAPVPYYIVFQNGLFIRYSGRN